MALIQTPVETAAQLLTVQDVAAVLKISVRHVYRLLDRGQLPAPRRLGGSIRFSRGELEAWVGAGCPATGRKVSR